MKNKNLFLSVLPLLLASCSFGEQSINNAYLNYKYVLKSAGDIHDVPLRTKEVLSSTPGFTNYTSLFDKEKSYINFQCVGTNFDDFKCETTFVLYDKNGNTVFGGENFVFNSRYTSKNRGELVYEDENIKNQIGTIYVNTAYWCRWQFEYDVDGSGNKTLLTFEFWKTSYNTLPEWEN